MGIEPGTPLTQIKSCGWPVFRQACGEYSSYYAPGYLAVVPKQRCAGFEAQLEEPGASAHPVVAALFRKACEGPRKWHELFAQPFMPVSLNLYLHDRCNLECRYCYSAPTLNMGAVLAPEFIQPAAELVAENCACKNLPMTVVFHGGGEPSLDLRYLITALEIVERVAAQRGLPLFRYIATNGVMPASRATWLAGHFDLVGLSCDGPEYIQACQRPLPNRGSSTPFVEQTARILEEVGARVEIRVTVTPESVNHQEEIARYLCEMLKPAAIHVEAVYLNGRITRNGGFSPDQASEFVLEFMRARRIAHQYGIAWLSSASRPGEMHATPCQILQQALQIIPGGSASSCFKINNPRQSGASDCLIGASNPAGILAIDQQQIELLQAKLVKLRASCPDCFNRFHCARGCPDVCPIKGDQFLDEFRCRTAQMLMKAGLAEIAAGLWDKLVDKTSLAGSEVKLDQMA